MSRRDDLSRLRDMLEHAREALAVTSGRTRADFERDRLLNLAVVRLLEIVGEAANHVTEEGRSSAPGIPWSQVVGFRNRVIHGYGDVDLDIVWSIVRNDLPTLVHHLEDVIGT